MENLPIGLIPDDNDTHEIDGALDRLNHTVSEARELAAAFVRTLGLLPRVAEPAL